MSKPWLLLDVSNMAYRSMYAMRDLRYGNSATGAIYGVFRELVGLMELFVTTKCVWCFDAGCQVRKDLYDGYKSNRKQSLGMSEEEKEFRADLRRQIELLRTKILKSMGFVNICWQQDFEADDIIASICDDHIDKELIIVSTDQDMYQLLSGSVSIYNPMARRSITKESFEEQYGIGVHKWAEVKAIAGCTSDSIPGIKGVGEVSAIKYLNGVLPNTTKAWESIHSQLDLVARNLKLTKLPMSGTLSFPLKKDKVCQEKWNEGVKSMGMTTLVGQYPMYLKKKGMGL